jgi:Domain of unknown function (DUF222)
MGNSAVVVGDRPAELITAIRSQNGVLWRAQARSAALMLEFADARERSDKGLIADRRSVGCDALFRAGEFAANEISMASTMSRHTVQRTSAMTRRVRQETPDVWEAWAAGDIDQEKIVRINRALRRLVRDESKALLNSVVVDIAVCRTPELLGRWLNAFIARVEPDQANERLNRALQDRYVSVRPDIDGMSTLHASMSALDATAIDQVLNAIAASADPGDERTKQQRRADALYDLVCGRISNGYHPDHDDPATTDTSDTSDAATGVDTTGFDTNSDTDDHLDTDDPPGTEVPPGTGDANHDQRRSAAGDGERHSVDEPGAVDDRGAGECQITDFERPASAFRPDPQPTGRPDPRPPTGRRHPSARPAISIGIVVSVQSLFGFTDTPGQLMDRSALVPAETIRRLAQRDGTLFHRLLTDQKGNLLDVTELGRFPSRKLGIAIRYRDGVCTGPTCTVPGNRTDIDHIIPVPDGPTTASNLGLDCRPEHRAKTHAGHQTARTDPHTSEWVTPTGHKYVTPDEPLPVEEWPDGEEGQV